MAGKTVDYLNTVEAFYDRWQKAVEDARAGAYSPRQLATDVAESWVDATYVALLPWSWIGQITIAKKPALPLLQFVVPPAKGDMTLVTSVAVPTGVTGAMAQNLTAAGGTKTIPSANVAPTLVVGSGHLIVSLRNLSTVPSTATADVYEGNVVGTPGTAPLARVQVIWPG